MCEQGEGPGQGTRRGKDFRALTHHNNASVDPSWQAVPDQAGDELSCGRAVVPADPGRQRGHRGIVQVQGTAVRGVGIQGAQSRLPDTGLVL